MGDSDSSAAGEGFQSLHEDMLGYGREPKFSADELAGQPEVLESDGDAELPEGAEADFLWPPASRVGNRDWCECGECIVMPVRLDCLCCQDAAVTVESTRANNVGCVTATADFATVVLHKAVLTTALRGYFEMKRQPMPPKEQPDNR